MTDNDIITYFSAKMATANDVQDGKMPVPALVKKHSSFMRDEALLNENLSPFIQALLTDLYQLTMCYGYWKSGRHNEPAVFDLFFRKNPFSGEYTLFAGLEECLVYLKNFQFTGSDIRYLKTVFPANTEPEFFDYLQGINSNAVKIWAQPEGSVVFPKVPLITVEGPLAICNMLETTLLNLVNYASLVATNAARFRIAAGPNKGLLEFGLRRAQGPNGGLAASKYCYIGGFEGTSNVLAGKLFHIPVKGTMAHSFVNSFSNANQLVHRSLQPAPNHPDRTPCADVYALARDFRSKIIPLLPGFSEGSANESELVAFCAYALAFPQGFLALVDTYDVARSGTLNFMAVALALWQLGYRSIGVRIDSGDLSYWSKIIRQMFQTVSAHFSVNWLSKALIVASNDINEEIIYALNEQSHCIDAFGVGTHLVTCQKQPALGCVYKLVSVGGEARMKLTADTSKICIPGRKRAYRLYGKDGKAIIDIMQLESENPPQAGQTILARHPFEEQHRALVKPTKVQHLHELVWDEGAIPGDMPDIEGLRNRVKDSLQHIREDHKRNLNPTPYKVSVSEKLYDYLHSLWLDTVPIQCLE